MKLVNIDWLEAYVLEPDLDQPRNAAYFEARGMKVRSREYGTPQYQEVFTIYSSSNFPIYEVRRAPYSVKTKGGIFDPRACHIRLSNRQCYQARAVHIFREFLLIHGYEFKSFSRVDICADFNTFDNGKNPQQFLDQFMCGMYFKSLQSKMSTHGIEYLYKDGERQLEIGKAAELSAHGSDNDRGRHYNSIKWGSPTSAISTKMYNKTLEMKQAKAKKYIQFLWDKAGLENSDLNPVWRVEFSLKSEIKQFVRLDDGELLHMGFQTIGNYNNLYGLFSLLAQRYFHFKRRTRTRNGTPQRKTRCPDFFPFDNYSTQDYVPLRLDEIQDPTRTDRMLVKRLIEYLKSDSFHFSNDEKRGMLTMLRALSKMFYERDWDLLVEKYQDLIDLRRN